MSRIEHVVVLSVYLVTTLLMTYPLVRHLGTAIPMDHQIKDWYPGDGDPWHYLWGFWYMRRALSMFPPPLFWTDLVFFPIGFEMPFLTGVGVILLPAALLEPLIGLAVTYDLFWILSFMLAGYTMYLFCRYLFRDRLVAFFCGHVFMFSSYRMAHSLEHLPLVLASFLVPLFAWSLVRATEEPTTRRWVLCALTWAVSAGISWYCTISLFIYVIVFALVYWRRAWASLRRGRGLRGVVIGLVVMGVAASPFAVPLMLSSARDSIVVRPLAESDLYAADLLAFFVPSARNPIFGSLVAPIYDHLSGNPYEQTVYIGYALLALACLGVVLVSWEKTKPFVALAAVFFVLALGPYLHASGRLRWRAGGETGLVPLPYLLLHYVPVLRGMRVPSRFTEILVFSLTVLAGYGLSAVCARIASGRGRWALVAVLAAGVAVESAAAPFPLESAKAPSVYADIGSVPGSFMVLELPLDWRIIKYHYFQTVHGKRLLVGHPVRSREKYSTYPPDLPLIPLLRDPRLLLAHAAPPDARRDAERLAEFFDVRYVVLHRRYLAPAVFERLDRFVDEYFPRAQRRVEGDVVVYTLAREHARALWPEDYVIDFGAPNREFALLIGWGQDERWADTTVQWSSDYESSAYLFLGEPAERVLEMRLLPFACEGCPQQTVDVEVNGTPRGRLTLKPGWGQYELRMPATLFRAGVNELTFRYAHPVVPARVRIGDSDTRLLAVAFDHLALRRTR